VAPIDVAAECGSPDRWLDFATVAPRADRLVIGEVTEILRRRNGRVTYFRLSVSDVLVGTAPRRLVMTNVATNRGCFTQWLVVNVGDRLAVAFDDVGAGIYPGMSPRVAAVAYLNRDPPATRTEPMIGMRRFSDEQVRDLVGLPPTDQGRPDRSGSPVGVLLAASLIGGLLGLRRFGGRRAPS
jgi:hypothetical protein